MISLFDIFIAVLVGLVGLAVLLFLFRQLLPELAVWVRRGFGSASLKRAASRLQKLDELLAANSYDLALRELERSFVLSGGNSKELVAAIRDHNHGLLSRSLIISEHLSGRLSNLADVERLLDERGDLQLLLLKTDEAYRKISGKRGTAGKDIPNWGRQDFEARLKDVHNELRKNEQLLQTAIRQLIKSIQAPAGSDITYH